LPYSTNLTPMARKPAKHRHTRRKPKKHHTYFVSFEIWNKEGSKMRLHGSSIVFLDHRIKSINEALSIVKKQSAAKESEFIHLISLNLL
jgi:hypothetical protein